MAVKLAEHFKDYEVLICTHLDRDHVHSHFIINSVSFETGRKFHISTPELDPIRQRNDALCIEYGFEICKPKPKHKQTKSMSVAEYHAAAKGESWKMWLMNTIDNCMKHAGSKEQFIELIELEGYSVKWTDSRKNITYTTPHGMKCRDDRLHETKYLMGSMELELRIREEIINGRTQTAEQTASDRAYTATAARPLLPHDTGEDGQSVLQPELNLGRDRGFTKSNNSDTKAKPTDKNTDEQLTDEIRAGANQQESVSDSTGICTGWEEEREAFFNSEVSTSEIGMVPPMDSDSLELAGLGSDLLALGRAVEWLGDAPPIKDSTTKPAVKE